MAKKDSILFIDSSNFYHSLKEERRLPFNAEDFKEVFDKLAKEYALKKINFYDALKNSELEPDQYKRQQAFHQKLRSLNPNLEVKTRKLRYINFDKGKRIPKEKGIDVLLVVDMIEAAISKEMQAAILLSGDSDFVPAVKLAKRYDIETINLHAYLGSSKEL